MKATVDVPDQLYRQVKARAAMEGRAVRDVTIELYEGWLATGVPVVSAVEQAALADDWIQRWEALGQEIAAKAVDPRSAVEILLADRR
jgi:hypothetical protein